MQCCRSARSVETARAPDPESAAVEQYSDRNRENYSDRREVEMITSEASNVVHSNRRFDEEETETITDVEAAFLVVSASLRHPITSKEKLLKALYVSGRHPSKRQAGQLWQAFSNEDGIDFNTFCRICRDERLPSKRDFLDVFESLDKHRSGYIHLHELESILTTRGEKMSKDEFKRLVGFLNITHDGSIRYVDFCESLVMTTHECREITRKHRDHRLREPAPPPHVPGSRAPSLAHRADSIHTNLHRSSSRDREVSEQQHALQQQLAKRHPESLFCKILDPSHAVRPKLPKFDSWNDLGSKGYFILDDPSKGGFITSSFVLTIKRETRVFASVEITKSQRLSERLQKLDIGMYIVHEPSEGKVGQIHLSEFGFGEVHGVCVLPPGRYFLLPYTTCCVLKDYDAVVKYKQTEQPGKNGQRPKSAGSPPKLTGAQGKLSKELMDCIEDVFRLFDLDADGFLSRVEFTNYYRNSEDEDILDDVAWNAILNRCEADGQKISFANFTKLFEMEIDDAEGDTEDLLIGLNNLGISRYLMMEEACGYNIQVLFESYDADARLMIGEELSSMFGPIREAFISETIAEGVELPSRRLAELGISVYAYSDDRHMKVVARNKSTAKTRTQLKLDASESVASLFASASGSLRGKDGTSGGAPRNVLTSTINPNSAVPLLFAVPTHPERMAEVVISSVDVIQP